MLQIYLTGSFSVSPHESGIHSNKAGAAISRRLKSGAGRGQIAIFIQHDSAFAGLRIFNYNSRT